MSNALSFVVLITGLVGRGTVGKGLRFGDRLAGLGDREIDAVALVVGPRACVAARRRELLEIAPPRAPAR